MGTDVRPHVKEFFSYLQTYKNVEDITIANYKVDLDLFFGHTQGQIPLDIRTITAYTTWLLNVKGDKRSSVRRRLSSLKSYYNFLYDEEYINVDVAKKIKYIKADPAEIKTVIPKKIIFKTLDSIIYLRDRALLETIYSTGIRESEACKLNIEDINWESKFLLVIRSKRKKSRVTPISDRALKYIKAYIGVRKTGPVFLNNRSGRISTRSVYTICVKYFNVPPHDLRHAFATHMIAETGNTKAVSEMLGHASEKMTEKYTHLVADHLVTVYRKGRMEK